MTKEDLSVPALSEFTKALNNGDHLKLIREWGDVVFYTVFIKKRQELELPMLYSVEGCKSFLASPDANEIHTALETFVIPEGADVFIKPEPLRELARNAYMLGAWLTWIGAEIIMNQSLTELFGMTALVPVEGGKERLYQARLYSLQGENREGCSVEVRSQYWKISRVSSHSDLEVADEFLIYDDRNSLIFVGQESSLPEARRRSRLTKGEMELFDRWARPCYDFTPLTGGEEKAGGGVIPDTYVRHPSLIDDALLSSFYDLERELNNEIMPDSNRLHLEVSKGQVFAEIEGSEDKGLDRVEGRKFRILFEDHPDWCLWLGGDGLALTDYSDEVWLPKSPGRHPVPECLRLKMVRAIAWILFWKGRELGTHVSLVFGQFAGVRPFRPDNLGKIFHPDVNDIRFPLLAAMPCGPHKVPVLIHGEVPEGYVVEVLEDLKVLASDLPCGIPRRDSLVLNGMVHFGSMCVPIVIPKKAVEFPDAWYTGVRTSNTQLISDFKVFLSDQARGKPALDKDPGNSGAVIGICLGFIAFLILLFLMLG
ncbi:hypothetical protein [Marinobacter sp. F3R11]|uniref:hypothetical protein n=1 Tax=Marinobacter sp. F3R11 TaxID=2267231 RepID=UPI000DEAB4B9|nr:hypothetical protein [Marinobacter sp. F3R11]RBW50232.1 hypothetical protein DS878_07995 [Marinobacter sp. F3R11]